jgi:hypothetical protein
MPAETGQCTTWSPWAYGVPAHCEHAYQPKVSFAGQAVFLLARVTANCCDQRRANWQTDRPAALDEYLAAAKTQGFRRGGNLLA